VGIKERLSVRWGRTNQSSLRTGQKRSPRNSLGPVKVKNETRRNSGENGLNKIIGKKSKTEWKDRELGDGKGEKGESTSRYWHGHARVLATGRSKACKI